MKPVNNIVTQGDNFIAWDEKTGFPCINLKCTEELLERRRKTLDPPRKPRVMFIFCPHCGRRWKSKLDYFKKVLMPGISKTWQTTIDLKLSKIEVKDAISGNQ